MFRYIYIYLDSIVNYTKKRDHFFLWLVLSFPSQKWSLFQFLGIFILDKLLHTHIRMFIYNMHVCVCECGCMFMCIIPGKAQTNIFPFFMCWSSIFIYVILSYIPNSSMLLLPFLRRETNCVTSLWDYGEN